MKYTTKVNFAFTEFGKDEPNRDSETFEVEAESKEEAHYKAFNKTISSWDENSIGITSIELV